MRRSTLCVWLLTLCASPSAASAWCRTTTVTQSDPSACVAEGRALAWPMRCLALALNPSALPVGVTASQARELLRASLSAWGQTQCGSGAVSLDLALGADTSAGVGYAQGGPNVNAVVFRRDWREAGLPPSALALTTLTFATSSGELRDADVQVNLSVPLSVETPTRGNDLPTVLLHEVGHVLGMDHSDDRGAVMYYAAGRGEQRRALTADDRAGACAVHPPTLQRPCAPPATDGGCACGGAPGGGRSSVGWLLLLATALLRSRRGGASRAPGVLLLEDARNAPRARLLPRIGAGRRADD